MSLPFGRLKRARRLEPARPELEPVAWTDSGTLMGVRHRTLPYWGVQFHPESVLTVEGPLLLANFLELCESGRESHE